MEDVKRFAKGGEGDDEESWRGMKRSNSPGVMRDEGDDAVRADGGL